LLIKEVEFPPFVVPNPCIGPGIILKTSLTPVPLDTADATDIRFLRFSGALIAVTVTPPGNVVFIGFVMICFKVTCTSLFGRMFTPVTLTPSTMLIPKAPKREEPLSIFAKFMVPKFIPFLILLILLSLLVIIIGCANAGLVTDDNVVKIINDNIPR